LRDTTLAAIETLHQMEHGAVPHPEFRPACEECTLFDQCLPKLSANRRVSQAARSLFDGGA
jgi:CRISPR/Cas system-associated exonuclease Cas4 (RecB family)